MAVSYDQSAKWPAVHGSAPAHPGYAISVDSADFRRMLLDMPSLGSPVKSDLYAYARPSYVQMMDLAIWANGVDEVMVYDYASGNIYDLGVTMPTSEPGVADQGSGSLAGTWTYGIRWYNSTTGQFSPISWISTHTASGTGESIRVSWTDPSITGVDFCQVFVSKVATVGPIYLVAEVAVATELYDHIPSDDTIDITLIAPARPAPGSGAVVPKFKYITVHGGRLFGFGSDEYGSRLWYSEPGTPWLIPALNYIDIEDQDGDEARGLMAAGETLFAFKAQHTYYLKGLDLLPGIANRSLVALPDFDAAHESVGAASHHGIVNAEDSLLFISDEGRIYEIAPGQLAPRELSSKLEGTLKGLFASRLREIDSGYDDLDRKIYWTITTDENPYHNEVIVLDIATGGLTKKTLPVEAMGLLPDTDGHRRLVIGDLRGNLFQVGAGNGYGARTGDLSGDVSGGEWWRLEDSGATFDDTSLGAPVTLIGADLEIIEHNIIADLPSAGVIDTLFKWGTKPSVGAGHKYVIGGCFPVWKFGKTHFGDPAVMKQVINIEIAYDPTRGNAGVYLEVDDAEEVFLGYFSLAGSGTCTIPCRMVGRYFQLRLAGFDGGAPIKLLGVSMEVATTGRRVL